MPVTYSIFCFLRLQLDGIAKHFLTVSAKRVQIDETVVGMRASRGDTGDYDTGQAVCLLGMFLGYVSVWMCVVGPLHHGVRMFDSISWVLDYISSKCQIVMQILIHSMISYPLSASPSSLCARLRFSQLFASRFLRFSPESGSCASILNVVMLG